MVVGEFPEATEAKNVLAVPGTANGLIGEPAGFGFGPGADHKDADAALWRRTPR